MDSGEVRSEGDEDEDEEKRVKEKERIADLWASFKKDTATLSRKPPDTKGKVKSVVFWVATLYTWLY